MRRVVILILTAALLVVLRCRGGEPKSQAIAAAPFGSTRTTVALIVIAVGVIACWFLWRIKKALQSVHRDLEAIARTLEQQSRLDPKVDPKAFQSLQTASSEITKAGEQIRTDVSIIRGWLERKLPDLLRTSGSGVTGKSGAGSSGIGTLGGGSYSGGSSDSYRTSGSSPDLFDDSHRHSGGKRHTSSRHNSNQRVKTDRYGAEIPTADPWLVDFANNCLEMPKDLDDALEIVRSRGAATVIPGDRRTPPTLLLVEAGDGYWAIPNTTQWDRIQDLYLDWFESDGPLGPGCTLSRISRIAFVRQGPSGFYLPNESSRGRVTTQL